MATKKTTEVKAETVEKVTAAAVETPVEKAAPAPEKKAAAKKTTAKKAETKPAAKKAPAKKTETKAAAKKTAAKSETEIKVEIQAIGSAITVDSLVEKAKLESGVKAIKKVEVYVRPEINKVYYVVNGDTYGDFDLFA